MLLTILIESRVGLLAMFGRPNKREQKKGSQFLVDASVWVDNFCTK